ncbi:hypothetical protein B0H67DRAFT_551175 [Lasiosphaeris hirsuta]|uniref:Uncharacterized protein n=1 Tax=Lasiosphaeris hirsuta TaxID=260670 RepID=A0AA40B0Y7_9PEZI|nr:hypothetical protein B0H67DRAFT_551175 [Lasiosphaeris hirsuta]
MECRDVFGSKTGISDKAWNQISLDRQLHKWWSEGFLAFEPLCIDYGFTFKDETPPMPRRKDPGSEAPPLEISKKFQNREALSSMLGKTYGDLDPANPEATKKAPVEKTSPPSTAAEKEESAVVTSPSKVGRDPTIRDPPQSAPQNRQENSDPNDSGYGSGLSSTGAEPARSLPNIILQGCESSKPVQLFPPIIPTVLESSEKGHSGVSKTISPTKQEGPARQKPTTIETVPTSAQKVAQKELKHKWSWASKGKTMGKSTGRSIRDFFKDGSQKAKGSVEGEKVERRE